MNDELFWGASLEELSKGYVYDAERECYSCLVCGAEFEDGRIFERATKLYEAKKAVAYHISDEHQSMFHYLVNMDKKYTGLTDTQKEILLYLSQGMDDKEIASQLETNSTSTIRSHRFKLREKEKQAKVFMAIMENLKNHPQDKKFIDFHKGANMVDERYAITQEEKAKILKTYFKEGLEGPLHTFPSKEKRKIVVLQQILSHFNLDQEYSEKEVNQVIKPIYTDFATVRRYFIEYGFMDRNKEGTAYWVK